LSYEEAEPEHLRTMAIEGALVDLGSTGNMRPLIGLLRGGETHPDLIEATVLLLEDLQATREAAVRRAEEKSARVQKILDAFDTRLVGLFGDAVENPKSTEELAEDLAEELGIRSRQVFNILTANGYKGSPRRDAKAAKGRPAT
jgi:hypothetical protein